MSRPKTAAELASAAADAIRGLNHACMSAPRAELEYPADAYSVVGALSELASRLPQAIEQIQRFITDLEHAGELRHDTNDRARLQRDLRKLRGSTEWAMGNADLLAASLSDAHSALAHLAYNESGGDPL
jgi:hypothetical protein